MDTFRTNDYTIYNLYQGIGQAVALEAYTDRMVIVDAGAPLTFFSPPDRDRPAAILTSANIPYFDWMAKRWSQIEAFLITHAHLDHYLGLAPLYNALARSTGHWPVIVADPIAQLYIAKQFEENSLKSPQFVKAETLGKTALIFSQFGSTNSFTVHCIPTVHSTWQTVSYIVSVPKRTPTPTAHRELIMVMSDWKWASGQHSTEQEATMRDFITVAARHGVSALVTEALNCDRPGQAASEDQVLEALQEIIPRCRGRLFFTCNARNYERIINFIQIAHRHDRFITFSGQSMDETAEILAKLERRHQRSLPKGVQIIPKYLPTGFQQERQLFGELPNQEQAVIITGHQAEEWSGLWQLAYDHHRHWGLTRLDTLIISADPIPGNEPAWADMVYQIAQTKATVYVTPVGRKIFDQLLMIQGKGSKYPQVMVHPGMHATGHAQKDDLVELITLINPCDHLVLTHWPENKREAVEGLLVELTSQAHQTGKPACLTKKAI